MDTKLPDERRRILRARGVPEAFIEALATRRDVEPPKDTFAKLGSSLAVFALVGLGLFSVVYLWQSAIELYIVETVRAHPTAIFAVEFMWQILPISVLILSLLLSVSYGPQVADLWQHRARPYPAPHPIAEILRQLDAQEIQTGTLKPIPAEHLRAKTEMDFLRQFYAADWRLLRILLALLIVGFLTLALLAAGNQWQIEGEQIIARRFWMTKTYSLNEVHSVSVGCHMPKKSGVPRYRLNLTDRSIDIGLDIKHLPSLHFGLKLYQLDRTLRARHILRQPYSEWFGPTLGDEATEVCLHNVAEGMSPEAYLRFKQIFSVN